MNQEIRKDEVWVSPFACWTSLLVLMFLLTPVSTTAAESLELRRLAVFGIITAETGGIIYLNDKEVSLQKGETARLEVKEYNPLDGVTPPFVEVVATVANQAQNGVRDIEVRISVAPKVASLVFIKGLLDPDIEAKVGSEKDPSTASPRDTEKTAEWFAPILLLRKTLPTLSAGGTAEVVFERIDLKAIIDGYVARKLWPTALRIQASVEPKAREKNFRNNTKSLLFPIKLPPY